MKLFISLSAIISISIALPSNNVLLDPEWMNFKLEHDKIYESEQEEFERLLIFNENLNKINEHNKLYEQGLETFKMGPNQFTDLTSDEFMDYVNKYTINSSRITEDSTIYEVPLYEKLPETVDWRSKKVVTGVKNQGGCGSCWSFSATGSLEGQYAIKHNKLESLSEQNLVDCSSSYGNVGCRGGWMDYAFKYVKDHGIESESSYPYIGVQRVCRFTQSKSILKVKSYVDIPTRSETALQSALANKGPVSVAIDATRKLQFYHSGLFSDAVCSPTRLNHGVLAVGYGGTGSSQYWLVKNSWGARWGESGYVRFVRNRSNHCGIATAASYPELAN